MTKILIDEATVKLVLEALEIEEAQTHYPSQWLLKAITALREAQPALCAPAKDGVCESLDCPNHNPAQQEPVAHPPCKGMNCGITRTDQEHSIECQAEHAAAIAGGQFVKPEQKPVGWKLVPIEPTDLMLKAMDECSTEGYDERLYAGHAASVYMAAVDVAPIPPEQNPKCGAIIEVFGKDWRLEYMSLPVGKHKLYTQQYTYTTPPQRTWQGLTKQEFLEATDGLEDLEDCWIAIEAKLKEKNA